VSVALTSFLLASFVETRERKEEMARLYAAAELSSRAKTRFLHMAAHELRTPITVVTGYLSMLTDGTMGAAPGGWKMALEILTAKAHELNTIVTDLLEASRIEADAIPRSLDQLDLRALAQEASERGQPRAELLGGEITTALPYEPVLVEADGKQVGRILDNLVNNGLSYTTRPPRITISVSSEAGRAIVRVADNGAGIPDSDRERVFERFQRTNDPAFSEASGTGLGLFISRQLAEGHGGSLAIESSTPGMGTVFALAIPLVPVGTDRIQDGPGESVDPPVAEPVGMVSLA
jgi:signal transduction histidine kinase